MKLRNKKTGEVFDAIVREKGGGGTYSLIVCDIKAYQQSRSTTDETSYVLDEYDTLAELNEEWEDYKPAKPLIKDEKIRKAVRAWAEANNVGKVCVQNNYCLTSEEDEDVEIVFACHIFKEHAYFDDFIAIDELCGEEEE